MGSAEFEIGAERCDKGDPAFHPDDHDRSPGSIVEPSTGSRSSVQAPAFVRMILPRCSPLIGRVTLAIMPSSSWSMTSLELSFFSQRKAVGLSARRR